MRTLSATLTAAQKASASRPLLRVQAYDKIGGINRLLFTRHVTGAEPNGPNAAIITASGALIRARADPGAADVLYTQRTAAPAPGSAWTTWPASSGTAKDVALATTGTTVTEIAVSAAGNLDVRESTDNGVTWGAWATIVAAVGTSCRVAAVFKSATVLIAFYGSTSISSITRTAGAWGAPAAWTNTVATVTGIAVVHPIGSDYDLVITGTAITTTNPAAWTTIYGDGDAYGASTWGPLVPLLTATAGALVSYAWPSLWQPDVFRCTLIESFTGTGAYVRPLTTTTTPTAAYVDNRWREPIPFNLTQTTAHRLSLTATTTTVWLSTPAGVWSAPITSAALDLTANVLIARVEDTPHTATAVITLANNDGQYAIRPTQLHVGAELDIAPGYATTAGNEYSAGGPRYWITAIADDATPGRRTLVLTAINGRGLLDYWQPRRTITWAAAGGDTYANILAWIIARAAALDYATTGAASTILTQQPAYAIQPGQTAAALLDHLLTILPEVAWWKQSTLYLRQLAATDASVYSYGGAGNQLILGAYYIDADPAHNAARISGPALELGESYSFTDIGRAHTRFTEAHNPALATTALLTTQADGVLRKAQAHTDLGQIAARPNCGLELYDIITITDARASLTAVKRRVIGIRLAFDTRTYTYTQTIMLGNP